MGQIQGGYRGPDIVRDGLGLYLDASNPNSYRMDFGNTWRDISGNNRNGTFINGPTYSSDNGGVIQTDGINDYIDIIYNLSSTNYTVIGAARKLVTTGTGSSGRSFSSRGNNWLMGHHNTFTENYFAEGWIVSGAGPTDTNWRIYAATGNISGDSYALYVNGVLNAGPSNGGSSGPDGFRLGTVSRADGEFGRCAFGFLLAYDRILSTTEILQNFNATKARFGL